MKNNFRFSINLTLVDYLDEPEVLVVHVMMTVELGLPIRRDHQLVPKRVCVDTECPEGAKVMHGEHVYHFFCFNSINAKKKTFILYIEIIFRKKKL